MHVRCVWFLLCLLLGVSLHTSWAQVFPGGGGGGSVGGDASCTNQVMTGVTAGGGINCTTITQAYVDNTIAKTGGDISATHQVIATHLAAPLPFPQGGHGLGSGAAGGVLYFATTTSLASSLTLALNQPVLGGGPGGAPVTGTRSGTTTMLGTVSGPLIEGRQLALDLTGNITTSAFAIGTPTQAGLVWNVVTNTCTEDPSLGKLTINALGQIICLPDAGGSLAGVGTVTSIQTTFPLQGGPILTTGTLSIANAEADNTTKGAAAFTASDFNATAGVVSLDYPNAQKASATLPGFLSAADWVTFNAKVGSARAFTTSAPLAGGGDFSINRTLSIANALADSATKGAAAFSANDFDTVTPGLVTLDYVNSQHANAVLPGFLLAADWITFTAKVDGTRQILTTAPLGGGGDLTSDRTLTCATCTTTAASLTANAPVLGAGGNAVAVGTRSGTTTEFGTVSGAKTVNKQLAFDASGNVIASATDIGSGAGGLADPGSSGYLVRTALNTTVARQLLGTVGNITVSNSTGVGGDSVLNVGANVVLVGQVNTFSGAGKLTGLPTPTADSDVAIKSYVDTVSAGLSIRTSVRAATTGALTASYANGAAGVGATLTNTGTLAALTLDGVALSVTNRVLVKNQASTLQNGLYTVTTVGSGSVAWVLTRATDYDATGEVVGGSYTLADEGTTQAGTMWIMGQSGTITVGTTPITFTQMTLGASTIVLTGPVTGSGAGTIATTLAFVPSGTPHLGSSLTTAIVAPGTPGAGLASVYVDQTSKNLTVISDDGVVKHAVRPKAAVASQWLTAISADGTVSAAQPAATNLSNGVSGSGAVCLVTSCALITPSLGVATATSINGLTLTPSTGTLSIANTKIASFSHTVTFAGTDGSTVNLGAGGTVVYTTQAILTTAPLSGGGDFSTTRTLSIAQAAADGTTLGVSAYNANDFNATAGVITLDYTNAQKATSTQPGFLLAADWVTFNTKVAPARTISTTAPLSGGGDLSADRTLSIGLASADGSTLGVSAYVAADFNVTAGVVSLDYVNAQKATAVVPGLLSATDWSTFTAKVTPSRTITTTAPLSGGGTLAGDLTLAIANALADGTTKGAAAFSTTDFETTVPGIVALDYVNGQKATAALPGFLSAADWSTFNAKQPAITWGPGLTFAGSTAQVASTEPGFLTNGGSTNLICGATNQGKMHVLDTGELQYCDGASTSLLRSGVPTQSGFRWNLTASTCLADPNSGKLSLNGSNEIICLPDVGGGTITPGTANQTTYYSATTTLAPSTAVRVTSTAVVSMKPLVTSLVNTNLTLDQHYIVNCTAGALNRTLTLPPAATTTVGYYFILKKDTGAGACQVARTGTDTINGDVFPVEAGTQWSFVEVRLESSGTPGNWHATVGTVNPFATSPLTSAYPVTRDDFDGFRTLTVASGTFTITLVPTASQPPKGKFIHVVNYGSGVVTIARSGQLLNGGTTNLTLPAASPTAPTSAWIVSTGVDYVASLAGAVGASGQKSWVHLPVSAAKLPTTNAARIDNSSHLTRLLFDNATSQCATWQFLMPPDYGSSPQMRMEYTMSSAATGSLNFDVAVASNIVTNTYPTANPCNDTLVPSPTGTKDEILCALPTPGALAASETQLIRVCRNTSGSALGDSGLIGIVLEYTKN